MVLTSRLLRAAVDDIRPPLVALGLSAIVLAPAVDRSSRSGLHSGTTPDEPGSSRGSSAWDPGRDASDAPDNNDDGGVPGGAAGVLVSLPRLSPEDDSSERIEERLKKPAFRLRWLC